MNLDYRITVSMKSVFLELVKCIFGRIPPLCCDQCCHWCFSFTRSVFFFCFIWGSAVFIENLGFFDSGQILEMYVVSLYFPFKNTVISHA